MGDARDQLIDTVEQLNPHLMWALKDLDEKQRYHELGTTNHIAYTAWHIIRGLDRTINTMMQGKPELWESKGYRAKLSMPEKQATAGLTHEQAEQIHVEPWPVFLEYSNEVLEGALHYLKNVPDADLEVKLPASRVDSLHPNGDFSKARVLRGRLTHASMHSGEIFALRGSLGLKGSPV